MSARQSSPSPHQRSSRSRVRNYLVRVDEPRTPRLPDHPRSSHGPRASWRICVGSPSGSPVRLSQATPRRPCARPGRSAGGDCLRGPHGRAASAPTYASCVGEALASPMGVPPINRSSQSSGTLPNTKRTGYPRRFSPSRGADRCDLARPDSAVDKRAVKGSKECHRAARDARELQQAMGQWFAAASARQLLAGDRAPQRVCDLAGSPNTAFTNAPDARPRAADREPRVACAWNQRPGVVLRVLPDFLPVAGTLGRPRALLRQFRGHEAEAFDWTGLIPPPRAS